MNNTLKADPVEGYLHPAIESYPRLKLHDIDDQWRVLLDAENVFWALGKRDTPPDAMVDDILSLYQEHTPALDPEIRRFRLDVDLSAVYINPTDRCNGRCPYCYIPQAVRETGVNMQPAELDTVLSKIELYHSANVEIKGRKPVIVFHGSEPLLVKQHIFEAIETYRERMLFGIQTNATQLEEKDVRFLIKNRVSVGLSLDSISKEGNQRTRTMQGGQDAYAAVMQALEWFDGYAGLNVITTITTANVHELPQIVELLHSKRVGVVLLNPVRCTAPGSESLRPGNRDMWRYFKQAVDMALELTHTSGRKIVISNFANTILAITAPTARRLMCDITPCGAARRFFAVMADGTAAPCGEFIGLTDFHSVNIINGTIEKAIASESFEEVRSRVVEKITECSQCLYRNICGAPCPAEIYASSGNLNNISVYCEFYKAAINYAFRLIAEGKVDSLLQDQMTTNMTKVYELVA
jgi:uncharacterized protein